MVSWDIRKKLAEYGSRQSCERLYHPPLLADLHDAQPKRQIPVNPNEISKPVLAEAKEALIISVKTAVSPPMTNLPIATTKAIKKKAIQI